MPSDRESHADPAEPKKMLLDVANLNLSHGKQPVLRGISLQLAEGQVVALLGPNGSGKSSLLRTLLGQHRATGSIQWNGAPLAAWPRRELARLVAYLAQIPAWQEGQTVAELLRLGRAPYAGAFGIESRHDVEVVSRISHRLGLEPFLARPLEHLSGGQRQRVFIARCLVQEPRALLLDEPNTHLDLSHQVALGRLLREVAAEKNIGILMASHDLNLAAAFADRLIVLHEGKVAAEGPPSEVLRPSLLEPIYGVPLLSIPTPHAGPLIIPKL